MGFHPTSSVLQTTVPESEILFLAVFAYFMCNKRSAHFLAILAIILAPDSSCSGCTGTQGILCIHWQRTQYFPMPNSAWKRAEWEADLQLCIFSSFLCDVSSCW